MDRRTSRTLAVVRGVGLAVACMVTYYLTIDLLSLVPAVGLENDKLGGMWAVVATIFVYRESLATSRRSAFSRLSATLIALGLCLVYLLLLPFTGGGARGARGARSDRHFPHRPRGGRHHHRHHHHRGHGRRGAR